MFEKKISHFEGQTLLQGQFRNFGLGIPMFVYHFINSYAIWRDVCNRFCNYNIQYFEIW